MPRVIRWLPGITLSLLAARGVVAHRPRESRQSAPSRFSETTVSKEVAERSASAPGPVPDSVDELIDRLFEQELNGGLPVEIQNEVARLLNLVHDVEKSEQKRLIKSIKFAIAALLVDPANLQLAKQIRKDVTERVRAVPVLRGLGLAVVVVAGLLPAGLALLPTTPKEILGFDSASLLLVIIGGALGSVISILTRIRDFVLVPERSTFWTGLFRPIIGIGSALFLFFVLSAGLVPTEVPEANGPAFFAAIAFTAGFSERLARDVARRTEDGVSSSQGAVRELGTSIR